MTQQPETITGEVHDRAVDLSAGAFFRDATVTRCDLGGQRVPVFQAAATTFDSCQFDRVRLEAGTLGVLPFALYRDCGFTRADLSRVIPGVARFERCTFDSTRIDKWFGFQAEFVDCSFVGTIRSVRFYGAVAPPEVATRVGRTVNEFRGNDFSRADLIDVEFVGGIDLDLQRWPDSPAYRRIDRLPERLRAARKVVATWPGSPDREQALAELSTLEEVYRDQPSIIRRTGQLSELFERIWETVEKAIPPS